MVGLNIVFPFLAAVLQAASFTLDKAVLSIRRVNFKTYLGASFPLIFASTLALFLIFRPPLSLELFRGNLGWLLTLSIAITIITNITFYRALDKNLLEEIQTFDLLTAIPVVLFSSLIFADERKPFFLIPALVASAAVLWSHWERRHFKIAKYILPFLAWSFIASPVEASVSKLLLTAWNPISLELMRSGAVTLILTPLFIKYVSRISRNGFLLLCTTNALTTVAWILFYFSYQRSGIVYTILIFSLQPLLVYFASLFFLKEPFRWKKGLHLRLCLYQLQPHKSLRNHLHLLLYLKMVRQIHPLPFLAPHVA